MLTKINPKSYDVFVGIDVSKKSYAMTSTTHERKSRQIQCPASPARVSRYFHKHYPGQRLLYVYEAGPTGFGLYDHLTNLGESCIMIHPAALKHAPKDRVKNDNIDSRKLAEQALEGSLSGIRIPSEPYRQLRHLMTTRQQYVRDSVKVKQRIKSLLLFESIKLAEEIETAKHWSARYLEALGRVAVKNQTLRFKLDLHLDDLAYLRQKILKVHRQLRAFYHEHPAIKANIAYLRSIPGFGFVVSAYLLSRVGEPEHLRNIRELGAFAGVVPSERSSGEKTLKGSITHMGDAELRSLLVEAAWIAIRKDKELASFYHRLRAKNAKGVGSKIAIVACARKLTHRAYRVLKDQRAYVIH